MFWCTFNEHMKEIQPPQLSLNYYFIPPEGGRTVWQNEVCSSDAMPVHILIPLDSAPNIVWCVTDSKSELLSSSF